MADDKTFYFLENHKQYFYSRIILRNFLNKKFQYWVRIPAGYEVRPKKHVPRRNVPVVMTTFSAKIPRPTKIKKRLKWDYNYAGEKLIQ